MTLLEKSIHRYGGWDLWNRLDSVEFLFEFLGGPLPILKGLHKTFPMPGNVRVFPKKLIAEFLDYPIPGKKITFNNGKVGIFDMNGTADVFDIPNYRETFRGFRKYRRWNPLDTSYFFGYAITQYLSVPFTLMEYGVREFELADGGFQVDAEFPQNLHTHCRRQTYRFDREGLLVRNDYTADIVGPWANGAHFTTDFQTIEGFPVATKRNVFVRLGKVVTPIPVLSAKLKPLRVNFL
ncbi:hypothetical protein EHQ76_10775 [Leptospira barantonii]|uniref:Uncharacterized protein n=1 Tax=Leptospira barantonii TaxID=2023184 RepID=A0A5F2B5Z7_9LEPT|nr:hypothetical protein [Leptospira barantonii]TGM01114.1 hypothetical protein EHQ76_10775 [Leptospira barantonii]